MIAGTLELQMAADVARIKSDMDKARNIVSAGAQKMQSALDDVRNTMTGLFGGISAAGFGMWIKSTIDFQDQLNDLNKTTGLSVEKLAGLSLMSKQTGSDLTGVAQSLNKLAMEMGKDADKFAKIGITAKDPLEAFKQLSEVFRGIEDPQLRAAVAAEALGKGWAGAAPALAEGADKIQEMVDRGELLAGITLRDAEMADEFNDSVSELNIALTGTASNLASNMLPLLTEVVKSLADSTHQANQTTGGFDVLTETLRAVVVVGGNVAFVIKTIGMEIGVMAAQVAAFLRGDFKIASQIGKEWSEDAAKRRQDFDAWEARIMTAGSGGTPSAGDVARAGRRTSASALRSFVGDDKSDKAAKEAAAAAKKAREEQLKRDLDALEEEAKVIAEINELLNDQQKLRAKWLTDGAEMVANIDFETAALTMTNVEREKAMALRELERTGIDKSTQAYRDLADQISRAVERRESTRETKQFSEDLRSDMRGALQRAFEDSKNPAKAFIEAFASTMYTRLTSKISDAILDALLGKAGGGGGLLGALAGGGGGMQGWFGGTSLGSSGFGTGLAYGNQDLGAFLHSGGIVGAGSSFGRMVNPGVFNGAPRFHTGGIAGDEVPIIAKRGEGVFTPAQMRALGGRGGATVNVTQNFQVGDTVTSAKLREELKLQQGRAQAGFRRAMTYGGELG